MHLRKKGLARVVLVAGTALFLLVPMILSLPADATHISRNQAIFSVRCPISHALPDDPIVYPGTPGASHLHDFYSNKSTNAFSTTGSMAQSTSTCMFGFDKDDLSPYWVPALLNPQGQRVSGTANEHLMDVYYDLDRKDPPIQVFPFGLRMIAGDSHATAPQPIKNISFHCFKPSGSGGSSTADVANIPSCPSGYYLMAKINFPSCWNGQNLDVADHKSHMAYPKKGVCPAAHPVKLPRVAYHVRWKNAVGGPGYSLASGGQYSLHGDFWNVWNPTVLGWLVDNCLNKPKDCQKISRSGIPVASGPFPSSP
ncbi:MAG: DUF1996 domain-containing protein [Actinomycetota bacterium]